MTRRNTVVRSLHDLGLAAWFGGSLMGAVAVNGASRDMALRDERVAISTDAWNRFTPVGVVAIGSHLVGSVGLLVANRGRVRRQRGVGASSAAKAVLTGVALGVTGYARLQGNTLAGNEQTTAAGATVPSGETHPDVAAAQQRLRLLQWAVPAATGGLVVLNAVHGEQQRPAEQLTGRVRGTLAGTARDVTLSARQAGLSARKAGLSARRAGVSAQQAAVSARRGGFAVPARKRGSGGRATVKVAAAALRR